MSYKVSIVILNWNGADMLSSFLPSVVKNSQGDDIEICVADNGSTDSSCEVLQEHFPSVRLIRLDRNYGFAEGYNQALKYVSAKYVVLLNSDIEVTEGWLSPIVDYMDQHTYVAACQPKILSYRNRHMFEYAGASGGFIDKYGYPFCRGRIFDFAETDNGQYDTPIEIFWATGAALFIRKDVYDEVGGLDGRFFAHMEEIDLCWRLCSRGYKLMCIPQSVVYHVGGATLKKENPRKTYLNFRNNLLMLYKNLTSDELGRVMFVRKLLDFVAAVTFIIKGDLKNAKAVIQARKDYNKMLPDFKKDREYNLMKAKSDNIPTRYPFLLVWKNKILGIKRFSDLS